jgi:hypothetical protein
MPRKALFLIAAAAIAACATAGGEARGSSAVLTRDEIRASTAMTAYEAIVQLRPAFLRARGARSIRDPSPNAPIVYLNDMRHGGIDVLRSIRVEEIDEIRFISAADATTRWGTGHAGGVIQVRANY